MFETKQIVHIATEIVILLGIVFYFSSKNKKLIEHIEELSNRLDEQEDTIQKHEQIIRQLVQKVNSVQPSTVQNSTLSSNKLFKTNHDTKKQNPSKKQTSCNDNKTVEIKETNLKLSSASKNDSSEEDDEDSELDKEIEDELDELQEQDGLKKRN